MTFSERLYDLMKKHDYKQTTLAEKLCVSQQTVSRWVTGKFQPDIEQLIALAKVFNVSVDYLLGCENCTENKMQPTAESDELLEWAVNRIYSLSRPALIRVLDFVQGLEAGQEIGADPAADSDSDAAPSQ